MKKIIYILIFSVSQFYSFAQEGYVEATVERNNQFAVDCYKNFNVPGENIVLSPFGVSNCMAMAYIGSEGETQSQIAKQIHFITPFGVLHSFKQLIKKNRTYKSQEMNLLVGNALWANQEIQLEKKYKNLLKVNFLAHVQSLPFKNSDKKSIKQINRWAKKMSNYNIRNLVRPETINENSHLIYTNFVYLSGDWENPFNEEFTGKDDFFLPDSSVRKIDFMNQTAYLKYNENEVFQIVELPYSGRNISMIVVLPKTLEGIDSIENALNPINFDFWTAELYTKLVTLSLPKFKSEFRQDIVPVISEMGCDLPFNDEANFKIISENKTKISKIIQHTLIEVTENKNSNLTELFIDPNDPDKLGSNFIRFNANHPFIYIVRDNLNKSILLMGKVISPNFNNLSAEYNLK
ncbi:MAG: serpin family protein [Bacteroidota bacterium]